MTTEPGRFLGHMPLSAFTPELAANPSLILKSPFFTKAEDIPQATGQECDCCPCCGCDCESW